jgi:hypothetical protein
MELVSLGGRRAMAQDSDKAFTEIGAINASRVFRVDSGIYLVRLAGYLTRPDSDALNQLILRDNKLERRAVLYEVSPEFTGYDPELRKTMDTSMMKGMGHIGIITTNTMLRMVTATIALGLRAAKGIPMKTYSTVAEALVGAREALKHA